MQAFWPLGGCPTGYMNFCKIDSGCCFSEFGLFFQPRPKKQKDGTMYQTIIPRFPSSKENIHHKSLKLPCKAAPLCVQTFKNKKGVSYHLNSCKYCKKVCLNKEARVCPMILIDKNVDTVKESRIAHQESTIADRRDQYKNCLLTISIH